MSEEKRSRSVNEFENLLGDLFEAEERKEEADAELFDASGFEELVASGLTDKSDAVRHPRTEQPSAAQRTSAELGRPQQAEHRTVPTASNGNDRARTASEHLSVQSAASKPKTETLRVKQGSSNVMAAKPEPIKAPTRSEPADTASRKPTASGISARSMPAERRASNDVPVRNVPAEYRDLNNIGARDVSAERRTLNDPLVRSAHIESCSLNSAPADSISAENRNSVKADAGKAKNIPVIKPHRTCEANSRGTSGSRSERSAAPAVPAHSSAVRAAVPMAYGAADREVRRAKRERIALPRPVRGHGAPFITSGRPVTAIYADMLVATLPAIIWAVFLFGVRCLAVIICSVGAAVLTELVLEQLLRHRVTVSDLSAVWSGVTVGMLMPPSVSFWVPMLASAVGIGVFKCALGGRGRTVISPALGGFAVLTLLMPSRLGVFTAPFSRLSVFSSAGEGASYLLSSVPGASMPSESIGSLFLGIRPGTIGEVSALMLLIGLAYLMARGVLSWEAPLTFVGISALLFYIFPRYSLEDRFLAAELLCGLIPICALVFAPDFACSPVFSTARLVYGALCGVLTFGLRYLGVGIYSAVYATLAVQILSRLLDSLFIPKCFGNTVGARMFHTEAEKQSD